VLGVEPPKRFDLIVFYRGLHCPICARYLIELERLAPKFTQLGVAILAASSDDADRAQAMAAKVNAQSVRFGYELGLANARQWGLYLSTSRGSTSIGVEEPALFSEPGVFLVNPDGTLYYGAVQTMPFARPSFQELLGAIEFAIAKEYPARGEYVGAV
jgi:peroxiredoxin